MGADPGARDVERAGRERAVLTIFRVAATGSTNADMVAMAVRGAATESDWLIADTQTAGRGRQGRAWASPPGNLYASGLVTWRAGDPPAPTLALVAGLAVWEALLVPGLVLKWPNDLRADGAKVAGILLERHGDAVVIGIGVNLAHHPALPERPTTSLAALGIDGTVDETIAALADAMARWTAIWRADLAAIRIAWLARAHPLGTALSVAVPEGGRIDGAFAGLSADCALQLRVAGGAVRSIHVGDVFIV
ncbi:MAG: biotin--[acetyl-CoA-carboxylase] ligase [Sphingomonadaceae bacterium]